MIKGYFASKVRQLKHISWFCAGFFFAGGINLFSCIALVLAIVLDFVWYILDHKKTGGA